MKKYTLRRLFNDIHLWLGIGSGIILFIVCLSGTILTFEHEIIERIDYQKYHVNTVGNLPVLSSDILVSKVEKELGGKVISLEIPSDKGNAYLMGVKKNEVDGAGRKGAVTEAVSGAARRDKGNPGADQKKRPEGGGRGKTYLVDPYTGVIKGTTEGSASKFFMVMMRLHRWLLIEGAGKIIVGAATIIFVILVFTGLVLWWPRKIRAWKQGFKIKTSANWKRINHDLHNTLGFYSFILLLIMGLTGLCWSFEWYRDGMSSLLGDKVFKQRMEKPLPSDPLRGGGQKSSIDGIIKKADEILPFNGLYRLRFPSDSVGSFVISKAKTGFFTLTTTDKIQFEQYTGKVLKIEKFADKPFNEKLASSVRSLHLGDLYGTFSKLLYFISCLIATSLPVTGTIIWINKLRKKGKKKLALKPAEAEYYDQ